VGSIFWFTARLKTSVRAKISVVEQSPAPLSDRRILVVDDNATNRKALLGQLRWCGIRGVAVSNGPDALTALKQANDEGRPFEVALVDKEMPDMDGTALGRAIGSDPALRVTRMVMLTSSGYSGESNGFAQIGFAGYLVKPVTRSELRACLSVVLRSEAEEWHSQTQPIVTTNAAEIQRARARVRLLVAEDNLINQKVTRGMLERLGYSVDIVDDGQAAVNTWANGHYDLILMDCQMPGLDGYEATREIRRREGTGKRVLIVALTADAMQGADERCRLSGMDDHLTKPIDRDRLQECFAKFLAPALLAPLPAEVNGNFQADPECLVDLAALRALGEDDTFVRELIADYINIGTDSLRAIDRALSAGDLAAVEHHAHSLKGASATLHAREATTLAASLEVSAHHRLQDRSQADASKLDSVFRQTVEYLNSKAA